MTARFFLFRGDDVIVTDSFDSAVDLRIQGWTRYDSRYDEWRGPILKLNLSSPLTLEEVPELYKTKLLLLK